MWDTCTNAFNVFFFFYILLKLPVFNVNIEGHPTNLHQGEEETEMNGICDHEDGYVH